MDLIDATALEHAYADVGTRAQLEALAPCYLDRDPFIQRADDVLDAVGIDTERAVSMLVHDEHELREHARNAHLVGYANARLSLDDQLSLLFTRSFPQGFCGIASPNVALSLVRFGYANAMIATNRDQGHTYVALPFVLGDEPGAILIDPTARQIDPDGPHVFVDRVPAPRWSYVVDWHGGADLYPTHVMTPRSLARAGGEVFWDRAGETPGPALEEAFETPVELDVAVPEAGRVFLDRATGQGA